MKVPTGVWPGGLVASTEVQDKMVVIEEKHLLIFLGLFRIYLRSRVGHEPPDTFICTDRMALLVTDRRKSVQQRSKLTK